MLMPVFVFSKPGLGRTFSTYPNWGGEIRLTSSSCETVSTSEAFKWDGVMGAKPPSSTMKMSPARNISKPRMWSFQPQRNTNGKRQKYWDVSQFGKADNSSVIQTLHITAAQSSAKQVGPSYWFYSWDIFSFSDFLLLPNFNAQKISICSMHPDPWLYVDGHGHCKDTVKVIGNGLPAVSEGGWLLTGNTVICRS